MNDDIFALSFSGKIDFEERDSQEDVLPLKVKGLSCRAGYVEGKHFIIPHSELTNIAETLSTGVDGNGAYILKDHGGVRKSVDSLVGRVTASQVEDDEVLYEGRIEDADLAIKIRKKLVSASSVGLRVNTLTCSICGRAYGDHECNHRLGELYPDEGLTELARPYLDKPIGAIVGGDIEAKEQSIVLYSAIEGASVGFNFSAETSEIIREIEERKIEADELGEDDIKVMRKTFVAHGMVVLSSEKYQDMTTQLNKLKLDYDLIERTLWLYANTNEQFIEGILPKIDSLDRRQLKFLWEMYQNMSNTFEAQGVVPNGEEQVSSLDIAREDVRQIIFQTRRSGKWNDKLKSIRDVRI